MELGLLPQLGEIRFGLYKPDAQERDGECFDCRTGDANHCVDPVANAGFLFEESRIDQVKAARLGNRTIDDDRLAVHA